MKRIAILALTALSPLLAYGAEPSQLPTLETIDPEIIAELTATPPSLSKSQPDKTFVDLRAHLKKCFKVKHFDPFDLQIFRLFVNKNPHKLIERYQTPDRDLNDSILHFVVRCGRSGPLLQETLRALVDHRVNYKPCANLYLAIETQNPRAVSAYLDSFLADNTVDIVGNINSDGLTPVGLAERMGHHDLALILITNGCHRLPPLLTALVQKPSENMSQIIKDLLEKSNGHIHPNIYAPWGESALNMAIGNGHPTCVIQCLLKHGAKPFEQDQTGLSPLEQAKISDLDEIVDCINDHTWSQMSCFLNFDQG
ncbi:MAG: ankyrin repeat domain-containing protein [Epsilonproteobacteria bacterium]|nr:ankyrin repeat domain-containing protein [Campylobacterota bacterium]